MDCNFNIWRGETKEPLALAGETGQGVRGIYYIRYRRTYTLFRYLFQYEDVGQKRSHLAIIEPIPHRF